MKQIAAWLGAAVPLILGFAGASALGYTGFGKTQTSGPALEPVVERQDVYVMGNSMFGTGFNVERLRNRLPDADIDFAYYNGHYTSMWHLAVQVGMNRENAPDTIVWGFRPTYANRPAFRQNKETLETVFAAEAPAIHRQVLAKAQDPNAIEMVGEDDDVSEQVNFSGKASGEPFERFGAYAADILKAPFASLNGSSDVLNASVDATSLAVEYLGVSAFGLDTLRTEDGRAKPTDLLISYVTDGRIQRADALVIDNGERFVQGEKVRFADSFVPPITERIRDLGSRQVVVIFKPVSTFSQPLAPDLQLFYDDALAYFEAEGVEVIDLIADPNMVQAWYASGDHFTGEGMSYITDRIAAVIQGDAAG